MGRDPIRGCGVMGGMGGICGVVMGQVRGYGADMGLWGRYGVYGMVLGQIRGYGVVLRSVGRCGAVGGLWGFCGSPLWGPELCAPQLWG